MALSFTFGLAALATLLPAAFHRFRDREGGEGLRWGLLILAVLGPSLWSFNLFSGHWRADFAVALWLTISASLLCFLALCLLEAKARDLAPLLLPYLFLLGLAAIVFQTQALEQVEPMTPSAWVVVHIASSVTTYALVTLAAVAGLSVFLSERALKRKTPNRLVALLPSMMDAERLQVRLLIAALGILAAGLASGVVLELRETGQILIADHKTILSLGAFTVIAGILFAHAKSGMRGRAAARVVLLAYLLLTLAYLGVKFVSEILLRI